MKAFFLTGSAALLLACGVTVFPAMAGGKIVNLTLRGARTHPVDIFNPQNETSVRQACPHPREQRSA